MESRVITVERIEPQPLPFSYTALVPSISEKTLRLHHDRHYEGYVETLNRLIAGSRFEGMTLEDILLEAEPGAILNNAAQAWNHQFYFDSLSANPKREPTGRLLEALMMTFGGLEEFRTKILEASTSLFGSGWVWLVESERGELEIVQESNAGNPIRRGAKPLLTIDVWEHAYYVDYENRRADAVKAFWGVLDWEVVERRYE